LKITVVANTSWNIFNFRLPLLRELESFGHEVHVIAPIDDYTEELKKKVTHFHPITLSRKGTNPFKDISLFLQFLHLYKSIKPQLSIQYTIKPNIYGVLAARRYHIPCICNVTGLGTVFLHDSLGSKIAKRLYKYSFKHSQLVFFQNTADRDLFVEKGLCKPQITDIIPGSGINTHHFQQEKHSEQKTFTFAYVGRMLFDKGIVELIEAIKEFKKSGYKASFIFAGAVETEADLGITKDMIQAWEKEGLIHYANVVKDMKTFLAEIDCVVLPSYREGTPRALLEAASMSLPIVATNVPGCKEVVIDEKNGFLCEPKNSHSLLEALKKMVSLPLNNRLLMGQAGRKRVKECFSDKVVLTKYRSAINNLVSR